MDGMESGGFASPHNHAFSNQPVHSVNMNVRNKYIVAAGVTTVKENSYSIAALQKPVTLTEVR